ncbi:putative HR-like lesion-inducer [Helianthus anomalus]
MGFVSFLGRLLFASLFILSAWQMFNDFGNDGGPAAKELAPKIVSIQRYLASKFGKGVPKIDVKHVVLASMVLKGVGGILFVFGSTTGAYLLIYYLLLMTPLLHDFYDYDMDDLAFHPHLTDFVQSLALLGALLFFLGMKTVLPRKLIKKRHLKAKTT